MKIDTLYSTFQAPDNLEHFQDNNNPAHLDNMLSALGYQIHGDIRRRQKIRHTESSLL